MVLKDSSSFKACLLLYAFSLLSILNISCERPERSGNDQPRVDDTTKVEDGAVVADSVTFYVDNSGGMFGYVTKDRGGDNNFILAVSDLAHNPHFTIDDVDKEYNFVNGPDNLEVTYLSNSAEEFIESLNPQSFNVGAISGNDLNAMLQLALEKADDQKMSVLISDGIYDIQDKDNPDVDLRSEGKTTRNHFIKRLKDENLQTLLIKFRSYFSGEYYYGATTGGTKIDQDRPFYVILFGSSKLLNKYLKNDYIENLDGYENHARFFLPDEYEIQYQSSSRYNKVGGFRTYRGKPLELREVTTNPDGNFQFSIAIDYSNIPLTGNYLKDVDNYEIDGNFEIASIVEATPDMAIGITSFNPTHMITLRATDVPLGKLRVKLKNIPPSWITTSHTDNDREITGDTETTFGLKYLMQGIVDAYGEVSDQKYFSIQTFTLRRN